MKVIFFSVKLFETRYIENANTNNYKLSLFADRLNRQTVHLARNHDAVCVFTNDELSGEVLESLHDMNIRFVTIRAAGYDNIDLKTAGKLGMTIANVPDYCPQAIAEHALMMMLMLLRKFKTTQKLMNDHDFTLDRTIGHTLMGKTVGILGTGKIGSSLIAVLNGFGINILAHDKKKNNMLEQQYHVRYVSAEDIFRQSDIISIHLPLTAETRYLISERLLQLAKYKAILINTSRGGIVNTMDVIQSITDKHLGGFGTDVYEHEDGLFFRKHDKPVEDVLLQKLLGMENVIVTPHQAFATEEALEKIAETTFHNLYCLEQHISCGNEIYDMMETSVTKAMLI